MGAILSIFSFRGRLRRRWFLLITLPLFAWLILLRMMVMGAAGTETAGQTWASAFLLSLPAQWPFLAAGWKRNHDQGRSGWWSLLLFVPLVGLIHYILLAVGVSEYGQNRFGPDPVLRQRDIKIDASLFN